MIKAEIDNEIVGFSFDSVRQNYTYLKDNKKMPMTTPEFKIADYLKQEKLIANLRTLLAQKRLCMESQSVQSSQLGPTLINDSKTCCGLTVFEIDRMIADTTKDLLEVIIAKRNVNVFGSWVCQKHLLNPINLDGGSEPHQFVEPNQAEIDTCARVRPLLKIAKRVVIAISCTNCFEEKSNFIYHDYCAALTANVIDSITAASYFEAVEREVQCEQSSELFDLIDSRNGTIVKQIDNKERQKVQVKSKRHRTVQLSSTKSVEVSFKPRSLASSALEFGRVKSLPKERKQVRLLKPKKPKVELQHDAIRNEALTPLQIKANVATRQKMTPIFFCRQKNKPGK